MHDLVLCSLFFSDSLIILLVDLLPDSLVLQTINNKFFSERCKNKGKWLNKQPFQSTLPLLTDLNAL